MSFLKYPAYKDSGVEWLGEVPAHWSANPLKRAFKIEGGSTPTPDEANWDGDIAWVTPADLSGLSTLFLGASKRTITLTGLASCGTTLLPAGSLILSTRAPIGSLAIALTRMCTNQGCKGLVPYVDASSTYYAYVLLTAKAELNNRGKGTTFLEISGDELGRFVVPTPPFPEQTQIARFLDHETARIDALIAEQQRLIELLKEKRQAVISHAVTKGLDPTVPMKDSGVEWLGEVPEHWSSNPLKRAFKIEGGSTPTPDEANWDGDIAWVTPADLSGLSSLFLGASKRTITPTGLTSCGTTLLPAGSLILSTRAPIGSLAIALISMCTNQGCKGLVPNADVSSNYFAYVLLTAKTELNNRGKGTTFLEISGDELGRFVVPTPPFPEQTQIARFLDHETARIDALVEEANTGVGLLQERRSALISAAVTGKIDVRNWQPPAGQYPAGDTQNRTEPEVV